jgi:hypothetical protein
MEAVNILSDENEESLTAKFIKNNEVLCLVITCLQLAVLLGLEGYIVNKIRRMFELSAILTISMYTVCIGLRAV